jgi:outer membrane protein assembly factor BamB
MKRFALILLVLMGALLLSACSSGAAARGSTSWPGLAADSENVYVADGSFVHAVSLKDGKQVWSYPEKASGSTLFFAAPILADDDRQLLVGSEGNDHALYSLDPKTGKEKWAKPFIAKDRWIASPLVYQDMIYAPNADGNLYLISMDGEVKEELAAGGALWSSPVTDGKSIYLTSLDHHFHAVDIASQRITATIDLGGAIPGGLAVGTDGIYVGSFTKKIEVISNGENSSLTQADNWIWGAPVIDGDTLYYADLSGKLYSLDLKSGALNWTAKPDDAIVASPLLHGDQVIVATEAGTVVAYDRDGKNVWDRTVGGKIYSNLVSTGDLILVSPVSADFHVAALDPDGKLVWTFTPEK